MTTAEPQHSARVDDFLHGPLSSSDEPINAHSFAERPTTSSTFAVVEKTKSRAARIPPPVPSPPSLSSRRSPPLPQAANPANNLLTPIAMASKGNEPQSQWLFSEEEIRSSPSVLDGLSVGEEISRRAKGVNFITQAGILLKIPQLTLGTASVFFHRFYMRYSMVQEKGGIHHYVGCSLPRSKLSQSINKSLIPPSPEQNIAATALFLATKAEENCRKTKEIVIAVVKVAQKNASLIIDEQSKEFWRWKDSILLYEEIMLELLTFDVVLESPYTCLYTFLKELHVETNKRMRNVAWAFLNDSCMTTLCLLMPPRDIAVASIYFSAKFNHERLPDDENGSPWWSRLNGVPERIIKAIDVMAEFYTDNPLKKSDNPYDRSPGSSTEDLDRTRLRHETPSPAFGPTDEKMDVDEEPPTRDLTKGETEGETVKKKVEGVLDSGLGDNDANLKAIANDPATHDLHENGVANGFATEDIKRKESEILDEPEAKRTKIATETEQDESEEGEVDE